MRSILNLSQTTNCRRKVILEYFGEKVEEEPSVGGSQKHQCNNCDTCLYPVTNFDGTEVTKKVICLQVFDFFQMVGDRRFALVLLFLEQVKFLEQVMSLTT